MEFVRGDSTNLPKVEQIMVLEYTAKNDKYNVAEIRGAKALLSSRDSYVDTAVGYVEVKREQIQCVVKAKVVPEHKVTIKQYIVTATINEKEDEVIETTCDGCAASEGGCKHTLLLLYWLAKRSSEPASTSVQCYWRKPVLSGIRSAPIPAEDIFPNSKKIRLSEKDPTVLADFLSFCQRQKITDCLATNFWVPKQSFNLFNMTVEYLKDHKEDYDKYMAFLNSKITPDIVESIQCQTRDQVDSVLWHSIRQGRITASKIHEASRCQTDGALVQQILGGYKVPETKFIKRGKLLEKSVIEEAEKTLKKKIIKSGLLLINGVVGASPDGVAEDFIIEVKCPSSNKTMKSYVDANGKISDKCVAQMQTQMLATKKMKAVLCVADPEFEKNKLIYLYWINYDSEYTKKLIEEAITFWKTHIYKKIINSARC